jgi:hypothetical protein
VAGFIVDTIGRRAFISLTFIGSIVTTFITYRLTTSVEAMMVIAPINGFFTLGCAYAWMAIYPCEFFAVTVRSTASSFVFNAARAHCMGLPHHCRQRDQTVWRRFAGSNGARFRLSARDHPALVSA